MDQPIEYLLPQIELTPSATFISLSNSQTHHARTRTSPISDTHHSPSPPLVPLPSERRQGPRWPPSRSSPARCGNLPATVHHGRGGRSMAAVPWMDLGLWRLAVLDEVGPGGAGVHGGRGRGEGDLPSCAGGPRAGEKDACAFGLPDPTAAVILSALLPATSAVPLHHLRLGGRRRIPSSATAHGMHRSSGVHGRRNGNSRGRGEGGAMCLTGGAE
jgi:hypothetical protein